MSLSPQADRCTTAKEEVVEAQSPRETRKGGVSKRRIENAMGKAAHKAGLQEFREILMEEGKNEEGCEV